MSTLMFQVYGDPVPQGSMRAFLPKGWNRPIITAANKKTKPWRQEIAGAAVAAMEKDLLGCAGKNVPFRLSVTFHFQKPKSVKKTVLEKVTKPDIDKLIRSVLDALTGIVWSDDSQVVEILARKKFGQPGVDIRIDEIGGLPPARILKPDWFAIPF
jgi:crossover junction endodeoxyribonuclease RusA